MKRARFTEDQIIGVLREHEAGAAALRALHEAAAPGVRRGVPDGSEGRQSCRRSKHAVRQCKSRLQREASGSSSHAPSYSTRMVSVPRTRLLLSHRSAYAAVQIDMDLEVSHRGMIRSAA